ncbi:hypothetical protein RT94_03980 [Pseudomonas viridiflava]|nr:hypothetical protein RT94_03980 [Pseudomonas viridiflava]
MLFHRAKCEFRNSFKSDNTSYIFFNRIFLKMLDPVSSDRPMAKHMGADCPLNTGNFFKVKKLGSNGVRLNSFFGLGAGEQRTIAMEIDISLFKKRCKIELNIIIEQSEKSWAYFNKTLRMPAFLCGIDKKAWGQHFFCFPNCTDRNLSSLLAPGTSLLKNHNETSLAVSDISS